MSSDPGKNLQMRSAFSEDASSALLNPSWPVEEVRVETGILGAVALMSAAILGAGILTIPHTFQLIGLVNCMVILFLVGILNWYSIYMLFAAAEASESKDYEELVHKAIPKVGKYITSFLFFISLFGALVSFSVIIMDLQHSVAIYIFQSFSKANPNVWYTDKSILLLISSSIILFPLCMLRNISKLEYSSSAAIFLIGLFTVVIVVKSIMKIHSHEVVWGDLVYANFEVNNIFQTLPILLMAYSCQSNMLPIKQELTDPTPRRTNILNICGNTLSFTLYTLMGFFGYVLYPSATTGDIIDQLPMDIFSTVFRALYAVAIIFHYPIAHFVLRNTIEVTFFGSLDFNWIRHTVITTAVVGTSLMVAIGVGDLSKAFGLTGALGAYPVSLILPAVCYLKFVVLDDEFNATKKEKIIASIIPGLFLAFSCITMVIAVYSSIKAF